MVLASQGRDSVIEVTISIASGPDRARMRGNGPISPAAPLCLEKQVSTGKCPPTRHGCRIFVGWCPPGFRRAFFCLMGVASVWPGRPRQRPDVHPFNPRAL